MGYGSERGIWGVVIVMGVKVEIERQGDQGGSEL